MASAPVKFWILPRRSTVKEVVVFTVAVWERAGNGVRMASSRIATVPTTVPLVPAARRVIMARMRQLPFPAASVSV
jgi:hypothetical protein